MTTNVYNNQNNVQSGGGKGPASELERLKHDLLAKREDSVRQGSVSDIQMIDQALGQIEAAEQEVLLQQARDSQIRLGNLRQNVTQPATIEPATKKAPPASENINPIEAQAIKRFSSVASMKLKPGEQFKSLSGKEPSMLSYFKKNREGLFDLLDAKKEFTETTQTV